MGFRRVVVTLQRVVEREDARSGSRHALRARADSRRGRRGRPVLEEPVLGAADSHTADQYRRAAEEARKLAAKATDSCERVQLLRLAAQWQRLADYKARLESKPPPQSN